MLNNDFCRLGRNTVGVSSMTSAKGHMGGHFCSHMVMVDPFKTFLLHHLLPGQLFFYPLSIVERVSIGEAVGIFNALK